MVLQALHFVTNIFVTILAAASIAGYQIELIGKKG